MVSEGVDIPRLRVGVYATAAKTPLVFRQIVGRFVRTMPGRPVEPSWLYIPADPVLRDHAASVETELRHVLRPASVEEGFDDAALERAQRTQTEASEGLAFVPLSADVAPQLTLFGSPEPRSSTSAVQISAPVLPPRFRCPARRGGAPGRAGVRAARAAPQRASPTRLRGAPPGWVEPPGDQRLAQPAARDRERRDRRRSTTLSGRSSCSSAS